MSANLCYFSEPLKTFPNADDMATLMHFPLEIEFDGKRKCLSGITEYTSCDDVIDTVVNHEYPRSRVVSSDYEMFRRSRGVETRLEGCDNMLKLVRSGRLGPGETLVIRFKKVMQSKSSHVCQPSANVITTFKSSLANPHLFESQVRRVVPGSHDSSEVVSRNHISPGIQQRPNLSSTAQYKFESGREIVYPSNKLSSATKMHETGGRFDQFPMEKRDSRYNSSSRQVAQCVNNQREGYRTLTDEFYRLRKQIRDQDVQLEKQSQRIKDTELEIEQYEMRTHQQRVKERGKDYVLKSYLSTDGAACSNTSDICRTGNHENNIEMCLKLSTLQDQIVQKEEQIDELRSGLVWEKVYARANLVEEFPGPIQDSVSLENTRKRLEEVLATNERQEKLLETINSEIAELDLSKKQQLERIEALLQQLNEADDNDSALVENDQPIVLDQPTSTVSNDEDRMSVSLDTIFETSQEYSYENENASRNQSTILSEINDSFHAGVGPTVQTLCPEKMPKTISCLSESSSRDFDIPSSVEYSNEPPSWKFDKFVDCEWNGSSRVVCQGNLNNYSRCDLDSLGEDISVTSSCNNLSMLVS